MSDHFPPPIQNLPLADIPLDGLTAHLSQSDGHQILFMHFDQDVELPEHAHSAQWGLVLAGKIEMTIAGESRTYERGDNFFILAGVMHAAKIHAGYTDITYFDEPDRYKAKTA